MNQYLTMLKNPPWDLVFIFMLVAAGFFWGISGGNKKMAMSILALYVLIAIFPFIPIDKLFITESPNETLVFRVGAFLVLLIVLTFLLLRSFKGMLFRGEGAWWEIFVLAVLCAGFFAVSLINLAPAEVIKNNTLNLSQLTLKFFADGMYSSWWTVLPILGVL